MQPAYELNFAPHITVGSPKSGSVSLAETSEKNILIDTVKLAENKKGYIFRLYECERSLTDFSIKFGFNFKKLYETDMMENIIRELNRSENSVKLTLKPFEIKTLFVEI